MNTNTFNHQAIIRHLNNSIRKFEGSQPYEKMCYSLAGWAEYHATEWLDTTVEEIDPKLSDLLYRIKSNGGKLTHADKMDLIDYGIAALDLRAPEDK